MDQMPGGVIRLPYIYMFRPRCLVGELLRWNAIASPMFVYSFVRRRDVRLKDLLWPCSNC